MDGADAGGLPKENVRGDGEAGAEVEGAAPGNRGKLGAGTPDEEGAAEAAGTPNSGAGCAASAQRTSGIRNQ